MYKYNKFCFILSMIMCCNLLLPISVKATDAQSEVIKLQQLFDYSNDKYQDYFDKAFKIASINANYGISPSVELKKAIENYANGMDFDAVIIEDTNTLLLADLIDLIKEFLEEYKTENESEIKPINYQWYQTNTYDNFFNTYFHAELGSKYFQSSVTCTEDTQQHDLTYDVFKQAYFDNTDCVNEFDFIGITYLGSNSRFARLFTNLSNVPAYTESSMHPYFLDKSTYNTDGTIKNGYFWLCYYDEVAHKDNINITTPYSFLSNHYYDSAFPYSFNKNSYAQIYFTSALNKFSIEDGNYIPFIATADGRWIRVFSDADSAKNYFDFVNESNLTLPQQPYQSGQTVTINNNTVIYNYPPDDPDPDEPTDNPSDEPSSDAIDYTSYFEMIRGYLIDIEYNTRFTLEILQSLGGIYDLLKSIQASNEKLYDIVMYIVNIYSDIGLIKDVLNDFPKYFNNIKDYSEQWNTLFEKISSLPDYSEQFETLLDTLSEFPDYSEQFQSIITKLEALPDYTEKIQTVIDKLNDLPDYTEKIQTVIDKLNALPDYTEKIQTVIDKLNALPDYTEKIQTVIDKLNDLPDYTDVFDKIYDKINAIYKLMILEDAVDILNDLLADYSEAATEVATVAKSKFPFCIPAVIMSALALTSVTSKPANFEIPFKVSALGVNEVLVVDWTSDWWAGCRNVVWYFSLFLALFGFIKLTISMTKLGGSE